jgi:hypothetical protein
MRRKKLERPGGDPPHLYVSNTEEAEKEGFDGLRGFQRSGLDLAHKD